MIPKIIHYIWLGGREIPAAQQAYINGWRQMMPDWEIIGWTEETIAIHCASNNMQSPIFNIQYCREAYEARKFAFASDYIRLWALEQYGGVYMDTDVEVIRSFDELQECNQQSIISNQQYSAFIGFEESLAHLPGTCVMGCEAHCQWVRDMLATYDGAEFIKKIDTRSEEMEDDLITNVHRLGNRMVAEGLIPNGQEQYIEHWRLHVYDFHHFSPLTSTRVMRKTKDTFAVHHFAASWHDQKGLLAKMQSSPIVCEILNALIQIKRFIKKYV